jgi:hypothetical protein
MHVEHVGQRCFADSMGVCEGRSSTHAFNCRAQSLREVEKAHFMPKSSEVVTVMRVHEAPKVRPATAAMGTSSTSAHFESENHQTVRNSARVHTAVHTAFTTKNSVLGVPCSDILSYC